MEYLLILVGQAVAVAVAVAARRSTLAGLVEWLLGCNNHLHLTLAGLEEQQ
jgi:membrane protein YqaA with SNARE-associated domain